MKPTSESARPTLHQPRIGAVGRLGRRDTIESPFDLNIFSDILDSKRKDFEIIENAGIGSELQTVCWPAPAQWL